MERLSFQRVNGRGYDAATQTPPYQSFKEFAQGGPISCQSFPPTRGQDTQCLPIFCDCAAGDVDLAVVQNICDCLIRQRIILAFAGNQGADLFFDRLSTYVLSIRSFNARGEEELELENSLRRMRILIGGRSAYSRLVHTDVLGDVLQHQWP